MIKNLIIFCIFFITFCNKSHEQVLKQLNNLQKEVKEINRSSQNLRIKIDELENRILLIEDEFETRKLADIRKKNINLNELPLVKLKPPEEVKQDEEKFEKGDSEDFYTIEYKQIDENGNIVSYDGKFETPQDIDELSKGENLSVYNPHPEIKKKIKEEKFIEESKILNEYKKAYELYREGSFIEALKLFENFVSSYPTHSYADNALYWIGECYYDLKDFHKAKESFLRIVNYYSSENKVPDAMLKVALCDEMLKNYKSAKEMYTKVILYYPSTQSALIAMRKIEGLK